MARFTERAGQLLQQLEEELRVAIPFVVAVTEDGVPELIVSKGDSGAAALVIGMIDWQGALTVLSAASEGGM